MSRTRTIKILDPRREVPPPATDPPAPAGSPAETGGAPAAPPPLEVDCLVNVPRPGAGTLLLSTAEVNHKNNRVFLNGEPLAYLKGPGQGRSAQDYEEAIPIAAGRLRSGVNRLRFEAGRDTAHEGVAGRPDRFFVQDVRVRFEVLGAREGPPVWLGVAGIVTALLAAVLALGRKR